MPALTPEVSLILNLAAIVVTIMVAIPGTMWVFLRPFRQEFARFDKRLERVEGKIDDLSKGQQDVVQRLIRVETDVSHLKEQVTELKTWTGKIQGEVTNIRDGLTQVQGKVEQLQKEVGQVQGEIAQLRDGLSGVEGEIRELREKISSLEVKVTKLEGDISAVRGELGAWLGAQATGLTPRAAES